MLPCCVYGRQKLIVFAAAGTTDVITEIAQTFESEYDADVILNFAASSTLARQIEAGAPADVYISANKKWMENSQRKFLANKLSIVIPKATEENITVDLSDFLISVPGRIAVGDVEHVPAGIYAKQALETLGCYKTIKDKLVHCDSVRAALRLAELDQVDAAIVYLTDGLASFKVSIAGTFDENTHEPIIYYAAKTLNDNKSAESFLDFLASDYSTAVFSRYGFKTLKAVDNSLLNTTKSKTSRLQVVSALLLSLKVATLCMLCLILPGILLGYILARRNFPGKGIAEGLLYTPLVVPPVVTGYMLLLLFGRTTILGKFLMETFGIEFAFTFKGAVIASAIVSLPLMVRSVKVAVELADIKFEQAANTLRSGPIRTFFLITLPLAWPGIVTGAILAFARSLGEFGATMTFVGNIPGQTRTLPLAIYTSLQIPSAQSEMWKMALISVCLAVGSVFIAELLNRRAYKLLRI
jgi:molybdate transport system permease protein